jgi:hypothetical protein
VHAHDAPPVPRGRHDPATTPQLTGRYPKRLSIERPVHHGRFRSQPPQVMRKFRSKDMFCPRADLAAQALSRRSVVTQGREHPPVRNLELGGRPVPTVVTMLS